MDSGITTVQWVSNLLYLLLAGVAIRLWVRDRGARGAIWVAGTFASGGLVVAMSLVMGPDATPPAWVTKILVVLLLGLPYSLHRFVRSMEQGTSVFSRVLEIGTGGLLLWTLAIPSFPGPEEEPAGQFLVYTLVFLGLWALLNVRAAWVLLRASGHQPGVIRHRLRYLAAGTIGLALAVTLPAFAPEAGALAMAGAVFGALSGLLFLVGFAPPSVLRAQWRETEEEALHDATKHLMLATSRDDVAETLLPSMAALVGARASALLDADGKVVAKTGQVPEEIDDADPDLLRVPVAGRQVVLLWTSPWSPLFGRDEKRLVDRLTVLSDLALDRAELFTAEQVARDRAELAHRELEAFIATITHDLRNPLTTIGGMADLLDGPLRSDVSDRAADFIQRIRNNTNYMGSLVDDILALAEVGQRSNRVEPVDLQRIADGVASEMAMRAPEAVVKGRDLPVLLGDPVRLRRLFENIASNAVKHGGREDITVEIDAVRPEPGSFELRFRDNGRGIPPEAAEKVFGLFERLEGRGQGTGLGLAICRRLVEQMNGSMWVANSDRGADLRVRFPAEMVLVRPTSLPGAQAPSSASGEAIASLPNTDPGARSGT